jgi:hypothetical protein
MTTPSPQPQPDGDWATKAKDEICRQLDLGESDGGYILSIVRQYAPAPVPTANIRRAALEEAAKYIRTHYVGLDDRGIAYEVKPMEKSQTQNSSRETHPVLADAMLKALGDL